MLRTVTVLFCFVISSCRCDSPPVTTPEPAELFATPASLSLLPAYVGQTVRGEVTITNRGGSTASVMVSITPPFAASVDQLTLTKGETETITVQAMLTTPGPIEGYLLVGELVIPIIAVALEVPPCAADVCAEAHFDLDQRTCVSSQQPEGTACVGTCIVAGQCVSGSCRGTAPACDDADACTIDACAAVTGACSHSPVECANSTNPCRTARCDPATGCSFTDADDGTLCGPDDCLLSQLNVCLAGACVARTRPAQARCTNIWVPATLFARRSPAVAWDPLRGRVLLFGGEGTNSFTPLDDTWEWEGTRWTRRTPPASPPPMRTPVMTWDAARSRMVLVGESQSTSQTWEWDGVTWLKRDPGQTLPARIRPGIAYDEVRRRVVIFGGYSQAQGNLDDTWEWNGTLWARREPAQHPPARTGASMVWDPDHRRVVLFAGLGILNDTWEWDGTDWAQRTPQTSPPRRVGPLAWDAERHRVVLFGGEGVTSLGDLWEWDGTNWMQRQLASPPTRSHHGMAWDARRSELIVVTGARNGLPLDDTWALNAQGWARRTPPTPGARTFHAMAWDDARQRVVLFGGLSDSLAPLPAETWEWDGQLWSRAATIGPSMRTSHAMTFDALRNRVVLFGGTSASATTLGDTWEWDGTTWSERMPALAPPPRSEHAMAFDKGRGLVFLAGGQAGEWEWDGTTWHSVPLIAASSGTVLAFYEPTQRMLSISRSSMQARLPGPDAGWEDLEPINHSIEVNYAVAYDNQRQRILLFEGTRRETWQWDGIAWSMLVPGESPPYSAFDNAMVFDRARGRAMLVGQSGAWIYLP